MGGEATECDSYTRMCSEFQKVSYDDTAVLRTLKGMGIFCGSMLQKNRGETKCPKEDFFSPIENNTKGRSR